MLAHEERAHQVGQILKCGPVRLRPSPLHNAIDRYFKRIPSRGVAFSMPPTSIIRQISPENPALSLQPSSVTRIIKKLLLKAWASWASWASVKTLFLCQFFLRENSSAIPDRKSQRPLARCPLPLCRWWNPAPWHCLPLPTQLKAAPKLVALLPGASHWMKTGREIGENDGKWRYEMGKHMETWDDGGMGI